MPLERSDQIVLKSKPKRMTADAAAAAIGDRVADCAVRIQFCPEPASSSERTRGALEHDFVVVVVSAFARASLNTTEPSGNFAPAGSLPFCSTLNAVALMLVRTRGQCALEPGAISSAFGNGRYAANGSVVAMSANSCASVVTVVGVPGAGEGAGAGDAGATGGAGDGPATVG